MKKANKNNKSTLSIINFIRKNKSEIIGTGLTCLAWVFIMIFGFDAEIINALTTGLFCGAITWLFVYDLKSHTYTQSWYPTIGMLGTFLGITFGLMGLDIKNAAAITDSLSTLLNGLMLAFVTSVWGLFASTVRKILDYLDINKIQEIDPVAESLQAIDNNTKQFDDENTVIAQLKTFNKTTTKISEYTKQFDSDTTISEQLDALRTEFTKFATKVTDSAAVQFADALSDVASDLNNKLSEQFGSNFKEFGTAVGQLIEWQKQNKDYMDEYTKQLLNYADTYNQKLEILTSAANSIENIIQRTDEEIIKLTKTLNRLDELGQSAKEIIPDIQAVVTESKDAVQQINNVTQTINNEITQMTADAKDTIKSMSDSLVNQINETVAETTNVAQTTNTEIKQLAADTKDTMKSMSASLTNQIKETVTETTNANKELIDQSLKVLNESATNCTTEMHKTSEHIIKTVDNMATNFANESLTKLQGVVGRMDKQLGEAGGFIAGAMNKMGTDIYELHNKFEDEKARISALEAQAAPNNSRKKTAKGDDK